VRWISLEENRGFPFAVNEGIRNSSSELVALLNNDTRAEPDWLERLVVAMDEVPEAAFAASMLLYIDRPGVIDAAGDGYSFLRSTPRNIGNGKAASAYARRAWVFGASAAASIYRRALFDDVGLFDEAFFLVFEDVDFDLRARVAGHKCVFVPDAVVYHKRGASTARTTVEVSARSLRNQIWCVGKNLPLPVLGVWWLAFIGRLAWIYSNVALCGYWPVRRSEVRGALGLHVRPLGRHIAATWSAVRALPAKRRESAGVRRLGSVAVMRAMTLAHRPLSDG
jgi:GT2 family glycosyltransferase